jgi:hypothetical protein
MKVFIWQRAPWLDDRYALALVNPEDADLIRLTSLFAKVRVARGGAEQPLNAEAAGAFEQWLHCVRYPLPSQAYARLSDRFLTNDEADRRSPLARRCAALWNALFVARPRKRLTHSDGNPAIIRARFDMWWYRQEEQQRDR